MLVLSAGINIKITEQLSAQAILRQHTLYYLTEKTISAFLHQV